MSAKDAPAIRRKLIEFDAETWQALDLLARDSMTTWQELADEAFRDLLHKHGRPTDLKAAATRDITAALNVILADVFALYIKTKNFHWHMSGPHFRDYHLLLDEQAESIEGSIDVLAERVRKIGGTTIRSIGQIASLQRIKDNEQDFVPAHDMLKELMSDNKAMIASMRAAHEVADSHDDVATASLLEQFIDEAEKRCWFLFEATRGEGEKAKA